MERCKKIPIVIVYNNSRRELVEQTLETIKQNTDLPYSLHIAEHVGNDLNYLKIKNKLVESIDYDWDRIIIMDDDLYLTKGWLSKMVSALNDNEDVWAIAGTTWPTHKHIEEREDITISDIICGGCWIMKKETWEKCGPYTISRRKTNDFVDNIHKYSGKVGFLKDESIIIHCGLMSIIDNKGRSPKTIYMMKKLTDRVNAKTNYEDSIRK